MAQGVFGMEIAVDGLVETQVFFEGFSGEVSNFRPFFQEVQSTMRRFFVRQFKDQGSGKSGSWQRLSDAYGAQKKRQRPGRKILNYDGVLRSALVDHNSPHAMREIRDDQFAYGTFGVDYASHHQYGAPKAKIPRRRIIDFDQRFQDELRDNMKWHARQAAIRLRRKTGARVTVSSGGFGMSSEGSARFAAGPSPLSAASAARFGRQI